MSQFEQRRPIALLQLSGEGPVPIKSASIVLEVNKPASAFVTSAANSSAGGQFRVRERDFGHQAKASAAAQNNFFTGATSDATLLMEDGKGAVGFSGLISQVSPSGRDASIQYALTSPITRLGGMSFSPIISSIGRGGRAYPDDDPRESSNIFSSLFSSTQKFGGFNIYRATELLYESGIKLAETFPPLTPIEAENFQNTLDNLKAGFELFKEQEDVFEGASISRPGLDDIDKNVNQSGFLSELLPLWAAPSFLQTLVAQVFPKFQLQLSSLLKSGEIVQRIEPMQIPFSPFSIDPEELAYSLTDIVWSPGTVSMLPPLCVTLLGQRISGLAYPTDDPRERAREPLEMVASYPGDVGERQGRIERFPAPRFFNTDMHADSSTQNRKFLKRVNKSAAWEADFSFDLASLKTRKFSAENMLKAHQSYKAVVARINDNGASVLEKWAEVVFYGRILSNTNGQMRLPFTPDISVGRTYRVRTDGTGLFTARVRRCVHKFQISQQTGEATTVVDFDNILVDGATLPS